MNSKMSTRDFLDDSSLSKESNLNRFIAEELEPDESFLSECGKVVDRIYTALREELPNKNLPYSVNKMVKGGSLGKGTALKNKSDVDLVLFLNGFDTNILNGYQDHVKDVLTKLEEILERFDPDELGAHVQIDTKTSRALKFNIKCKGSSQRMDVDLLPCGCFDIDEDFIGQLKQKPHNQRSHPIFVDKQREFVGKQPAKIKNLIRLVKQWRYTYVPKDYTFPSSYPFELLAIYAVESLSNPDKFEMTEAFKKVMEHLADYKKLKVIWHEYYAYGDVGKTLCVCPAIIDPANSTVNLCKIWDVEKWGKIAEEARRTMKRPMITGQHGQNSTPKASGFY